MIRLKESYGYGYRLFDTETGKYVANTPESRREALFCLLVANEIKLAKKDVSNDQYSVEKIAKYYGETLYLYSNMEFDTKIFKSFKNRLDENFALYGLLDKEENEVLAYSVLKDQQNEKTKANVFDIYALKEEYKYLNNKIFANQEEKEL